MGTGSLRSAREFERVRVSGRRAKSDGVSIVAARATDGSATAKLGLAVGRASGNAVTRNRIRRRLRAAWLASEPAPGFEVVVRATPAVASMDFQDLVNHMKSALSRATVGAA
jgi:ribonuclease P protein component